MSCEHIGTNIHPPARSRDVTYHHNGEFKVSAQGYETVIVTVDVSGGGDECYFDALLDGSMEVPVESDVTSLRPYALTYLNDVTEVSLPEVINVGENALSYMQSLETVYLPKAEVIGSRAFIESNAIKTIDLPAATTLADYAFLFCRGVETINLPNVTSIGLSSFGNCYALKTVNMPSYKGPSTSGLFGGCTSIEAIDINFSGNLTNSFVRCTNLKELVLRDTTLVRLSILGAFDETPFAASGSGGILYVPQSLIDAYTYATNWSALLSYPNNQILPIEGSKYE